SPGSSAKNESFSDGIDEIAALREASACSSSVWEAADCATSSVDSIGDTSGCEPFSASGATLATGGVADANQSCGGSSDDEAIMSIQCVALDAKLCSGSMTTPESVADAEGTTDSACSTDAVPSAAAIIWMVVSCVGTTEFSTCNCRWRPSPSEVRFDSEGN